LTTDNARLLRLATYASVATASLLILAKLGAWLATGSVTVLASLVDSLMDVGASLTWSRYACPLPTRHRSPRQAEPSGLAGRLLAGSSVFLVLNAVDRLRHPPLPRGVVGRRALHIATAVLLAIQYRVIARTQSPPSALAPCITRRIWPAATVLALVLALYGWSGLDLRFALAIAAWHPAAP
jgi:ferrous-iron efflux pump FieF